MKLYLAVAAICALMVMCYAQTDCEAVKGTCFPGNKCGEGFRSAGVKCISAGLKCCVPAYIYSKKSGEGPSTWGNIYPVCNGNSQSPINIDTKDVVDSAAPDFLFHGYDEEPEKMELTNNGKTLEVEIEGDVTVTGGGLPGIYKALQFHFHWGANNIRGSEHTIDNKTFPLEMHIVHRNTKYSSSDAANHADGLAVLGVLFDISEDDNEEMNRFLSSYGDVIKPGTKVEIEPFAIEKVLPSDVTSFYRYQGSLTTPPCSESVVWTIFKNRASISKKQLEKFRRLLAENGKRLVDNFRPVQNLNGRIVKLMHKRV